MQLYMGNKNIFVTGMGTMRRPLEPNAANQHHFHVPTNRKKEPHCSPVPNTTHTPFKF